MHAVFLPALPYGGGERLVRLRQDAPGIGIQDAFFSPPEIPEYAAQTRTLSAVAEYHSMFFILLGGAEPERLQTGCANVANLTVARQQFDAAPDRFVEAAEKR